MTIEEKKKICIDVAIEGLKKALEENDEEKIKFNKQYLKLWGVEV